MIVTYGLILAGGSGERMKADLPKAFLQVGGVSMLRRSADAFARCPEIEKIVVVVPTVRTTEAERLLSGLKKPFSVVGGGRSRFESAKNGFSAISEDHIPENGFVAVHDAARCLITPEQIASVVREAQKCGAATASAAMVDTVKKIDPSGRILATIPRDGLVRATTPQVFRVDLYRRALAAAEGREDVTDDNQMAEIAGIPVVSVPIGGENIKITYPEDLAIAEAILAKRGESRAREYRVGQGYDVHAFAPERKLILGGVEIPHRQGLLGHSDADVLAHAIMDALLGAAALGDIGQHFPDRDPAYAGVSSLILLSEVKKLLDERGARIIHIDATLILQAPKVASFIPQMRRNIADRLGIAVGRVSVKATTEERLGFTGREEGAAAQAIAMLDLPAEE